MNILVLAGGLSPERDVSLASGAQVANALQSCGYRVVLLDPYKSVAQASDFEALHKIHVKTNYSYKIPATEPDLAALKAQFGDGDNMLGQHVLDACKLADCVFLALHGAYGENGQLQAALDLHGVCYTGSEHVGCVLSMNKTIAKMLMQAAGVKVPPNAMPGQFPAVVKPANGGSSIGVSIAKNQAEFDRAMQEVCKYDKNVLVEPYIKGREFAVAVFDGEALPVIEICPKAGWFDYANKYQANVTDEICPAGLPEEIAKEMQHVALKAHNALRLGDYSRADFILSESGEIFCLEVNSLPGLAPASLLPKEAQAAGIPYEELCEKIVQLAIKKG